MKTNPIPSPKVSLFKASIETALPLPLAASGISAGFPSPALDFAEKSIDLNLHLIKHPASTFYGRVRGNSMVGDGISDGDLVVIDKSLDKTNNKIAVCFLNGEFTLKRVQVISGECLLLPANPEFQPIKVSPEEDFIIWGIVTYIIKSI